jgi:hypothetical protein
MLADVIQEDRRIYVLLCLTEAGGHANEAVLRKALVAIGHKVDGDDVRAVLAWLEQHALIRLEKLPMPSGEVWVAHLLEAGEAVANGKPHPGIARPPLR